MQENPKNFAEEMDFFGKKSFLSTKKYNNI